ncbi:hypothetical protein N7533_006500 [Penicillium manginii]|uniref:uncharacterized protein n=1 Tax=Penicillium manginii TaxID=203109 RepID=UPI002547DF3F|nr:uncharacterized protein N7533_006500 [Penicillium manginii]KAJ5749472.1 hypothetical protein N7533_006500 [Penicillium manginii]
MSHPRPSPLVAVPGATLFLKIQDHTKQKHASIFYIAKLRSRSRYLKIVNGVSFLNSNVCAIIHGPCIMSTIKAMGELEQYKMHQ